MKKEKDKDKEKEKEKEVKTSSKKVTRTTPNLDLGKNIIICVEEEYRRDWRIYVKRRKMVVNPFNPKIKIWILICCPIHFLQK